MYAYLDPEPGDNILEVGAGSGFFSFPISRGIGEQGLLYVTDPSIEQLQSVLEQQSANMIILAQGAEEIALGEGAPAIDKIWSRGAFHHVRDKTETFSRWRRLVHGNSRMAIFDIFSHNRTARFFDGFVARSCVTGHEVSYLSKDFATSLCANTGWREPEFHDIDLKWSFENEQHLGRFLGLLLANKASFSEADSVAAAKHYLGVRDTDDGLSLDWPMTMMTSSALPGYE
ncbi:class I SAM-dependent methyltransferase [Pseudomonas wadenswilerensis]|nr:class I SAM-dependent methyltransferase [Pseudomonas wadenswilerensis]